MAFLKFLKGDYSRLSNAAINEGQVLICGDTGEMFVDVAADKRVKIGDFVVMSDIAALEALDASAVPTSRLYYVENGNILARSNGTEWVQINKQKTLAQLGGVSQETYNTKIAALEKADTDNATAISGVDTRLQAAEEKLKSVATTEGLSELTDRVGAAETDIDNLQAAIGENGSVTNAIAEAKQAGLDAAALAGTKTTMAEVEAKNYATKEEAQGYANAKDEAIGAAQARADEAYNLANGKATMTEVNEAIAGAGHAVKADVDTAIENLGKAYVAADEALETKLQGNIDKKVDQTAYDTKMTELAGADTTLQGNIDALVGKVGTVPEGSTVMGIIANIQENAYDDTEVRGLISDNADAIAAEKERAEAAEAALQEQITTNANAIEVLTNGIDADKVDGVKELIDYVDKHGAEVTGMKEDIADNAKAISDHEAFAAETYETKEDATSKKTEIDGRLDVLEGKVDVEKVSTAISTAVEGAVATKAEQTALDEAVEALEGADEALTGRIDDIEERVGTNESTISLMYEDVASHTTKIGELETAVSDHEQEYGEFSEDTERRLSILEGFMTEDGNALVSVIGDVQALQESMAIAEGEIDTLQSDVAAAEAAAASALSAAKTELEGKITSGDEATLASAEAKAAELDATLKTELQGKIDLKANSSDIYTKTETFTKDEINALFTWGNF